MTIPLSSQSASVEAGADALLFKRAHSLGARTGFTWVETDRHDSRCRRATPETEAIDTTPTAAPSVRPEIAAALIEDARLRICDGWGAAQLGPGADTPVVSDVPTLLLAGEYDPFTATTSSH